MGFLSDVVGAFTGSTGAAAATQAAGIQSEAAGLAEAGINRRFDETQAMMMPQVEAGDLAREQQMQLLGLRGADAQGTAFGQLQESPGQAFLRERGERALLQNQAAIGGLGGGNVRSELQRQGIGFAQQDLQNQFSRLGSLSGAGGQAASNIGQFGGQAAGQAGQAIMAGGEARAGGVLGAQQARTAGVGNIMQLGGMIAGGMGGGAAGAGAGSQFMQPVSSNIPLTLF
jgi:hypothetical protein